MRTPTLALFSACVLGFVKAAPAHKGSKSCSVSNDVIPLPAGQTSLTAPTDAKPVFIAAGFGTQNYSCSATGTYASIGAVAELFDASCVVNEVKSACSKKSSKPTDTIASMRAALGPRPFLLGHHYFITNPTPGLTGVSPKFDFTSDSQTGNPNAFVVTAKTGNIPAPTDPKTNIDWLELQAIAGQGDLAKYVFRIFTVGGQPPASCTPGSAPITVPYAANYWFFK